MGIVIEKAWHDIVDKEGARYPLGDLVIIPVAESDSSILLATDGRKLTAKWVFGKITDRAVRVPLQDVPKKDGILEMREDGTLEFTPTNGKHKASFGLSENTEGRFPPTKGIIRDGRKIGKVVIGIDAEHLAAIQRAMATDGLILFFDPESEDKMIYAFNIRDAASAVGVVMSLILDKTESEKDFLRDILFKFAEALDYEQESGEQEPAAEAEEQEEQHQKEADEPEPEEVSKSSDEESEDEEQVKAEEEEHEESVDELQQIKQQIKDGGFWQAKLKVYLVGRSKEEAAEVIAELANQFPNWMQEFVEIFQDAQLV